MYELVARARMIDQMSGPLGRIKSELRSTGDSADRTGRMFDRMGSIGGSAFKTLAKGAVGATLGITAIAGAIAFKAIPAAMKLSSDAEQAGIAFTTMLGSADKAQKFLGQLADFANKTPFELPQVRDAAKKMLAFGFSAEQVIPMLTAVGNAASGLGLGKEGIDRITLALGQIHAKSKVSGEELLQLQEAGISATQILATKMGVSTAQVMKMTEKGIIPADRAIQALIEGMNKQFPDMMAKQSKTTQGLWSTIHDTFDNKLLVKFGDGISSALKPRFQQLANWIDANQTTINRWGANIQRITGKVADWFTGAFVSVSLRFNQWISDLSADKHFQALSWDNKLKEIARQALTAGTSWLTDNIDEIAAVATELGVKVGKAIVTGVSTGILEGIYEHNPLTDMSPYTKGMERLNSVSNFDSKAKSLKPGESMLGPTTLRGGDSSGDSSWWQKTKNATRDAGDFLRSGGGIFSHAGGLSSVPYNRYPALLHKDERVLTKAEADASRKPSAPAVNVTGNTFIVRQDSDIDAIARALARELAGVR